MLRKYISWLLDVAGLMFFGVAIITFFINPWLSPVYIIFGSIILGRYVWYGYQSDGPSREVADETAQ